MPTDTQVNDLKINVLSEAQYEQIQSPSNTELYLVPEVIDTTPTSGSTNPITSGGVYSALQNIPSQKQADWNETDATDPAYIKNKPTIGKVVRVCHLKQDGKLVEDKINPVRTDEELYLVTFDSNTIPSQWIVCDGDVVVDYTVPDVPLNTFQKDDKCLFLGKYVTSTNTFTQQEQTSLVLQLLFHSRWGAMIATKQDALPSLTDNAGKVLAVNNNETGMEWVNQSNAEDVFVCNYSGGTQMDKSPQDIYNAHQEGKIVVCLFTNLIFHSTKIKYESQKYYIEFVSFPTPHLNSQVMYIVYDGSNWQYSSYLNQKLLIDSTTASQGQTANIKTINGNSLLGSGDIYISGDILIIDAISYNNNTWKLPKTPDELISLYDNKVMVFVNVMGELFYRGSKQDPTFFSISGYIRRALYYYAGTENGLDTIWYKTSTNLQSQLISGTNIKTINGNSILGGGDLTIGAVTIYSGTTAPSSSTGSDGDIYIQTQS